MIEMENLDIRTVTLGVSLRGCGHADVGRTCDDIYARLHHAGGSFIPVVNEVSDEYGIPIINKRMSVTPISLVAEYDSPEDYLPLASILDASAKSLGVDFLGGYSALVQKGATTGEVCMTESIPEALATTERLCSSVNVATTRAGINMNAVSKMGHIIKETAQKTADRDGIGCAKLVVFANAVEDNPFMAGAFHGPGEPEVVINVGVSGPGVVLTSLRRLGQADLQTVAEVVKRTVFKITRAGMLVGREASRRLGVPFGVIDLSLAPTPAEGDSVGAILEEMGLESVGAPGSTCALAMLVDAVKKGGMMAATSVGGLSGAFIPVSEDAVMARAVETGALTLEKLEAMTAVCSVGLDMVVIPGDTPAETIAGIIADEMAIGVINDKTTAVRIIPAPGKKAGDTVNYGGLLGSAPVMNVSRFSCRDFIRRAGRIPPPTKAMRN